MELSIREEEVERMEEYSKTIEELYENMRKFKHDYKNILLSLYEFIEEKKYDDLEKYYKENILETESYVNSSDYTIKLKNIKITPIKALIASKLIRATNNKINVFVDVSDEILRIPINYIDAIRILGNLLDNAIEGALETEEKCLNFGVVYKGSSIVFIIENSCRQDIPPIYKLLEKGFSTKGNNRGMGLSSVKQIVNEDENLTLNIEVNNGIFRIELWMRVT
jgi:two-component system sensor histidine kinase AgrC